GQHLAGQRQGGIGHRPSVELHEARSRRVGEEGLVDLGRDGGVGADHRGPQSARAHVDDEDAHGRVLAARSAPGAHPTPPARAPPTPAARTAPAPCGSPAATRRSTPSAATTPRAMAPARAPPAGPPRSRLTAHPPTTAPATVAAAIATTAA